MPYTIMHLKAYPPANTHAEMMKIWGYKELAKRYVSFLPLPMVASFAYSVSLCTSANLRKKDDFVNYFVASGVFGLTLASVSRF